jgi:hypothetical protein
MATAVQVTFDCADPARLARFWADALGYRLQDPPAGFPSWPAFLGSIGVPESEWNSRNAAVDPAGLGPRIFFQRVPEPKRGKNRVHLDIKVGGDHGTPPDERRRRIEAEAARLVGLGATRLSPVEERGDFWIVMTDPEGNEFCVD